MDKKSGEIVEFNKVKEKLVEFTSFSASHYLAEQLMPSIDEREVQRWQAETSEAVTLFESSSDVTVGGARDIRPAADRATRGITLQPEDLLSVRDTIVAGRELRRKLERSKERVPHLFTIGELIEPCPGIVSAIGRTLDERGEVLDSASTKLADIRRQLRVTHGRIQDKLRGVLSSHAVYLQESLISQRNGRYVVPVRAESKTNVRGIVHDTSGSGATLWVEPLATVELNNSYRELQVDETNEIQRLLQELSQMVADQSEAVIRVVDRLAELDLVFAKAKFAGVMRAIEPEFVPWRTFKNESGAAGHPGSTVWFKGARHPLLDPEMVVPVDLTVPEDIYLVLITGPNTGGKTVSLKTLGLMVMMAQAGLRLPCREARLTLFDRVLADIGDEQSIEQNLSTFSGHMINMIRILDQADDRALVILDELGSGTDPTEGAALAMSIIDYLRDVGATVFTATHYPELKAYATQTAGATNASLLFDIDTLSPTYEMTIGLPGKSNALAIARRLGLEGSVIDGALSRLGEGSNETEELLDSIYDMRDKIASEEAAARLQRRRAERDRQTLQDRLQEIEVERAKILQETRQQVEEELSAIRQEIRRVRQQLKGTESRNLLKRLGKEVDIIEERPLSAVTQTPLIDSVMPKETKQQRRRKLRVGDEVTIKTINTKGEILSLTKDEAEIAIGRLHMRASLDEIEFRGRPVEREEEPVPVLSGGNNTPMELDIRGERVESGLERLDKYLDGAALSRLPWVRIIHGKGTGRLREAVRQALTKSKAVVSWEEGKDGEGGAGVTVARLEESPES